MTSRFQSAATLTDLAYQVLDTDRALVRSAWCSDDGNTWRLRMLEIVVGTMPSGFESQRWRYPNTDLIATEETGERVSSWLRDRAFDCSEHQQPIGESIGQLKWERRESHARTGYEVLEWPSYEAKLDNLQTNEPKRPLLSDSGAPSFASFYNAAACFFGLGASPQDGSTPTSAIFRWVDTRARISSVEIAEDELRVVVEGQGVDGLVVELASDVPGHAETLETTESTATVTFPLPDGLPSGAWVVVRTGSEWLDRRFLTWPWARGQEPGVTVEVPAKTKLDAFIAGRENDAVEFKREIPEQDATKAKAMKTVCAFANGSGGSLLFGITDDYEVVGLPEAKANRYADTLSEIVDVWVEPIPAYSFDSLPVDGTHMVVIELIVNAGLALYGSSKPNEPRRVYVRHQSRSVPARVWEIETIVKSRSIPIRYPT